MIKDIESKMEKERKIIQKIGLDVLLFIIFYAGLGMVVGVVVSSYQETVHSLIDTTPYQNFALYTGAIVGLLTTFLALICYLLITKFVFHQHKFNLGLILLFCGAVGAVIDFITYYLVTSSGKSYGIVERTGSIVVIDGIISAVLGGGIGILIGIGLSKIRNYERRHNNSN